MALLSLHSNTVYKCIPLSFLPGALDLGQNGNTIAFALGLQLNVNVVILLIYFRTFLIR